MTNVKHTPWTGDFRNISDGHGTVMARAETREARDTILKAVNAYWPLLIHETALAQVIDAVRDYLPPNGISKDDLISRVIAATDNPAINMALTARRDASGAQS